ncbi:hypothetical protein HW49_11360 [Porphyromonadaceae bacterium COT-184 OH4590]|nr:hypothetical protein HW49_11360 [Porphyromonadaceae bacterium COT-184 OH4590]
MLYRFYYQNIQTKYISFFKKIVKLLFFFQLIVFFFFIFYENDIDIFIVIYIPIGICTQKKQRSCAMTQLLCL